MQEMPIKKFNLNALVISTKKTTEVGIDNTEEQRQNPDTQVNIIQERQ